MSVLRLLRLINPSKNSPVNSIPLRCFSSQNDRDSSIKRTFDILKGNVSDYKDSITKKDLKPRKIFPKHCDILVVGGGVMGCSIAYWLQERVLDGLRIVVLEKDPTVNDFKNNLNKIIEYQKNTSVLSVGGLRQQFSLRENIELSLFSAEFMRNIKKYLSVNGQDPPDIQFNPCGYLFLASEDCAHILQQNAELQLSLGARVELLSADMLKRKFPFMNTDGIALGCHGLQNEGWFDPWSLLNLFKRKAISLGTEFISGELVDFDRFSTEVVVAEKQEGPERGNLKSAKIITDDGEEKQIDFSILVIAAGANSGCVAKIAGFDQLGYEIPVEPRKRYVYNIHCPEAPGIVMPFIIDNTGAYVRREGLTGHYLCGMSPPNDDPEPSVDNLDVDYEFYENRVWPAIASRVPCFENSKLKSAWAGFYDYNKFDENCFIGPHPAGSNVYLATGFSGHGIQQAPGIGRAIMEMIVDGGYMTIDLSRFEYSRFIDDAPLWESNIV